MCRGGLRQARGHPRPPRALERGRARGDAAEAQRIDALVAGRVHQAAGLVRHRVAPLGDIDPLLTLHGRHTDAVEVTLPRFGLTVMVTATTSPGAAAAGLDVVRDFLAMPEP